MLSSGVKDPRRVQMEDKLREMRRQRTSLARQVGSQPYSDAQFEAINGEINTLEYSLREQYGYGVTGNCDRPSAETYEQQEGETGGEFLARLMADDPFAGGPSSCSTTRLPILEEGDEFDSDDEEEEEREREAEDEDEESDENFLDRVTAQSPLAISAVDSISTSTTKQGKERHPSPSTGAPSPSACQSSSSPGNSNSEPDDTKSPEQQQQQKTTVDSAVQKRGIIVQQQKKRKTDCGGGGGAESEVEILEVRRTRKADNRMTESERKRQRTCMKTGLEVVMEEPATGEVKVSRDLDPSPPRPKDKERTGLQAVFMQTPLPHQSNGTLKGGNPNSAPPAHRSLTTPLSNRQQPRPSAGSFFSRMWGRLRSFSKGPEHFSTTIVEEDEQEETEA